jgi:UDP-N-acetylglucosamine--N-acetylmuramyl-(pentapeptide) pyrophosphoryl-undecaprenol N-acetylglucosamine transferase
LSSNSASPRLIIAAGGTGGHIYPGLAVAEEFRGRFADAEVLFVGTSRGLESKVFGDAGYEVEILRAKPLRGGSLLRKIRGVWELLPAYRDAGRLLRRVRPDAVVGVGGYISGPLLLAASRRRIPTLILEPNFDPGLTNLWLARFVDAAAVAWEDTATHFRGKGFVAGNPVRPEIAAVPDLTVTDRLRVLLFGGSQGSTALNDAMVAALPHLQPRERFAIVHQTGPDHLEGVRVAYARHGFDARVEAYLPHMDREYAGCDLVVSRAGATTCAELCAAGRGAVLVPLELAGGHQRHNADAMRRAGAAVVVPEAELKGRWLAATLAELAGDPRRIVELGRRARENGRPDAAARIVDRLGELLQTATDQRLRG